MKLGSGRGHLGHTCNIHRLCCCHGGLPQPAQEGICQLPSKEEQHVRLESSFVCLYMECGEKRGIAAVGRDAPAFWRLGV